jgi:hypothetical protein
MPKLSWDELVKARRKAYRRVFRIVYMVRSRSQIQTTRRGLEDSLRLALLAREAARLCLEVVKWNRERELRMSC